MYSHSQILESLKSNLCNSSCNESIVAKSNTLDTRESQPIEPPKVNPKKACTADCRLSICILKL